MREDIEAAVKALDQRGREVLVGTRASGATKRALSQLPEFLPNEVVLAVATARDVPLSAGEQLAVGRGAAFKAVTDGAKSVRLLVLTADNLYEVQGGGRLKGKQAQGVKTRLADITDVRSRSERSVGRMLAKDRILMIDHMRGHNVETTMCTLSTDSELAVFQERLTKQVAIVAEQAATPVAAGHVSVADELVKLVQLRDAGVLTDAEFADQKAKLL